MTFDIKKAQPVAIWGFLVFALGLGGNALWSANSLENLALANEKDIFHERELRVASAEVLERQLEDLDEDLDELKKDFKTETGEIKGLLNQLLLRQASQPIN